MPNARVVCGQYASDPLHDDQRGHLAVYGNASAKFTDTAWTVLKTQSLP